MTSTLLDPHTDAADAVLAGVAEVHGVLDRLHEGPPRATRPGVAVAEVERAIRRLEAYKLKIVAAADKTGVAADAGFTDTGAWVARQTTTTRSHAAREVALATELEHGLDTTSAALDAGLVSPEHASVILRAGRDLPRGVSDTQRQQVEAALVAKAQRFAPDQLRRVARRAVEAIEPDQQAVDAHENQLLRSEEEAARNKSRLSFHDNADGTVTGHFTVPALAAGILQKVLESMTAPRRLRDTHEHGASDRLYDWDHRRGLALAELLEHLPTDHLHPKTAATVVVTIDHQILEGALKAAHLDTGHTITAGEARRLACKSGLIPAVLGGASVALDLGRESRLATDAQRLALGLQHSTCAADGCERPFAWCELHHKNPWSRGGRTDLEDLIPLCHRHHRWVHDTGFSHRTMPEGSVRFSRRT